MQELDAIGADNRDILFVAATNLSSLVEQAIDEVIEEAIDTGGDPPLRMAHLQMVLETMRPSTLEWLGRAKNYVEFANGDERYSDIAKYLKSKEGKLLKHANGERR